MNPIIRAKAFSISLPLLFVSSLVVAENSATELNEIVVTATRTAQTIDDTLASVTVLTQVDIQKQQASSLQELLQARAGFQVVNSGGAGKNTSLFLRGTNSDHVLVMIDGIKINTATDGAPPLSLIPLELIERIEIVRGPRTSLYGSDAIGGVIQIFTKKSKAGASAKPSALIKAGSHSTQGLSVGLSGGLNKGWYSANLKREKTDGYNACTGSSTIVVVPGGFPGAGCFTEEFDKDSYDNTSASISAGYQLTDKTKISAQFLRTDNEIEFDGSSFAPNEAETLSQIYGLNITSELNDQVDVSFSAGHNDHKNENFQSGSFFSRFDTKRDTYSLQSNIGVSDNHLFTVGFDYLNDKVDTTSYTVPSRDNKGLFAEYQGNIANHNIVVGLRNDDNEQFGNHATGNIAVNHAFNGQLDLTASYGTAFKAPNFDQLYFPFFGNPDLNPEQSKTAEIGLRGKHSWGNWSSNLYRTEADDLIVFDSNIFLANNVAEATIKGFETIVNTQVDGWNLGADLTLLRTEDKSNGPNNGNELARRPEKSFRLNLDKDFGKFSVGSSVIAEGRRFDDAGNNLRVAGYTTADLRIGYELTKRLTLQAKVGNIFDKTYETAAFFPQDGRNYTLTLRYTPK